MFPRCNRGLFRGLTTPWSFVTRISEHKKPTKRGKTFQKPWVKRMEGKYLHFWFATDPERVKPLNTCPPRRSHGQPPVDNVTTFPFPATPCWVEFAIPPICLLGFEIPIRWLSFPHCRGFFFGLTLIMAFPVWTANLHAIISVVLQQKSERIPNDLFPVFRHLQ